MYSLYYVVEKENSCEMKRGLLIINQEESVTCWASTEGSVKHTYTI